MVAFTVNLLSMNAVRKDLFESGSNVITSTRSVLWIALGTTTSEGEGVRLRLELDGLGLRRRGLEAPLLLVLLLLFPFSSELRIRGLAELRGLSVLPQDDVDVDVDGVGDAGRAMLSGIGLGGIGEGSCHRFEMGIDFSSRKVTKKITYPK